MYLNELDWLIKEWDYELNKKEGLDPTTLLCGSNKKAWRICPKGHSYKSSIYARAIDHNGCPYCAKQKVLKGFNDFATNNPELLKEWDYEKNDELGLRPDEIINGGQTKFWWKCSNGHTWLSTISNRKSGHNCPYCANQKARKGFNDLITLSPDVAKEWDYEKNAAEGLFIEDIVNNSNKKAWWICSNGHSFKQQISDRTLRNASCPICLGKKFLEGFNDLLTVNPELCKEWDYEKNDKIGIFPNRIYAFSPLKVWRKCNKGHSWQATIAARNRGENCPYCCGNKVWKGFNDFASLQPELLKERDYDKNEKIGIFPNKITDANSRKVWWLCPKGHSYLMSVDKRTRRHFNCPYCSGQRFKEGINDLATLYPNLVNEWHPTKNGNLTPNKVPGKSYKKYWWLCPAGHAYLATPHDRGAGHTNCPICNSVKQTSFPEQTIYFYLKQLFPDTINRYKTIFDNDMELDVYIPELNIGIEYDGGRYHKGEENRKKELRKYSICKDNGIYLIRVKEGTFEEWQKETADKIFNISTSKKIELIQKTIISLFRFLGYKFNFNFLKFDIDIEKDRIKILSNYLQKIDNSLAKLRPDVLAYWDYDKNGTLNPEMLSVSSNQKVWWICPSCGHSWYNSPNAMTSNKKANCPICIKTINGRRKTEKYLKINNLKLKCPKKILEEFDYEKNELTPEQITIGSAKSVWWKCSKCGYSWKACPRSRIAKHTGCPHCSGRVCMPGVDDLETLYPEIAKHRDYNKNTDLPSDYLPGSERVVYWICPICGESYQKSIHNAVLNKSKHKCKK